MQSARDNIKDAPGIYLKVGLESLRGTLAVHQRGPPARVRRPGRSAPARGPGRCLHRGRDRHQLADRVSGEGPRAAKQGLLPSWPGEVRAEVPAGRGDHDRADRLLAIAMRELQATQEEFRRVASRLNGGDPLAAWQRAKQEHPPGRSARARGPAAARGAAGLHPAAAHHQHPRGRAGCGSSDAALLSLDVCEHVDAGPVRDAREERVLLHHRHRSRRGPPSGRPSTCATSTTARSGPSRSTRSFPVTSSTTSICDRLPRSCASRSSSHRPPSWRAGRTTASR